jgi:hypothetical protein
LLHTARVARHNAGLTQDIPSFALRAIGCADVRFGIPAFAVKTGALNCSATSPFCCTRRALRATTPV